MTDSSNLNCYGLPNAENNIDFVDKIYRSFGILKYAKKLDQQEGEELISNIKVGVD